MYMNRTKQAELEYKLRIYLKHININKFFNQYISDFKNNSTNENDIIQYLYIISNSIQIMNRTGKNLYDGTYYSKNENIDDFIDEIKIVNMNDKILDILLEHVNFINTEYILYENNADV